MVAPERQPMLHSNPSCTLAQHRWSTCQLPRALMQARAQTPPHPLQWLPHPPLPRASSPWLSGRRCGMCTSASPSWRTFSGACAFSSEETTLQPVLVCMTTPRALFQRAHAACNCPTSLLCSFARSNTRRGIETCGILAGTLSANDSIFTISTLIIPKQEGTTDTVQALGEEEIFDVQDSRGLYPLGWIHTHPTQSCFLSSIDVHTHCGYQVCSRAYPLLHGALGCIA